MEPKLPTCTEAIGEVMKRLLVLGLFVLGITALGSAGQNGNNQGQNDSFPMPEGPPFEFVYGLLGAASWGLWRWRHSKTRNGVGSGEYKFLATYSGSNRTTAQPEYHYF